MKKIEIDVTPILCAIIGAALGSTLKERILFGALGLAIGLAIMMWARRQ